MSQGAQLIFGMALQTLLMSFSKKNKKSKASEVEGATIKTLVDHFTQISLEEFQDLGGFWIYLREGEGVVVPPMTIIGHVNPGLLEHPPGPGEDLANVTSGDFLEPWLWLYWYFSSQRFLRFAAERTKEHVLFF